MVSQFFGNLKSTSIHGRGTESKFIGLLSNVRCLIEAMYNLIIYYQTAKCITRDQNNDVHILERQDVNELVDIDIWCSSPVEIGTVNSIVRHLTTEYDSTYMKTVIYTYRSFTTPEVLFNKLFRRFQVPPEISEKDANAIQLRVCVVLKYWLQNQFHDFDDYLVDQVKRFIKILQTPDHDKMAVVIETILKEKVCKYFIFLIERFLFYK